MGFPDAKITPSPPYTPPGTIEVREGCSPLELSGVGSPTRLCNSERLFGIAAACPTGATQPTTRVESEESVVLRRTVDHSPPGFFLFGARSLPVAGISRKTVIIVPKNPYNSVKRVAVFTHAIYNKSVIIFTKTAIKV